MSIGPGKKVTLDLRGDRISIDRESLMELPESVLLVLFPNGVVLSPQRQLRLEGDEEEDEGEDIYLVDFDAKCLQYILEFFTTARNAFYGPPEGPRRELADLAPPSQLNAHNPLFLKQAIIVLREELEYFAIPPKGVVASKDDAGTTESGLPNPALLKLKNDCGASLLARTSIFTALQRNVNRENNQAEQHLIDMLCMSGFEREDTWGYRSLEPNRCCISSIALVLLKTGIEHPPFNGTNSTVSQDVTDPVTSSFSADADETGLLNELEQGGDRPQTQVDRAQLATAQKLLLFWRKPARKCWWDATELPLSEGTADEVEVKVWARRVWTLELSLI